MEILKLLQERHTTKKYDASRKISDADFDLLLESLPDTCLYLSDMGLTKIEHTQPALSDTTADTLRKFTAQEAFVEI